jgi:DNA polymerase III subunit alpha
VELIVFSDCFEKCKSCLSEDNIIMLTGRVSTRENENPKVIASDIFPLDSLSKRFKCQLVIKIDEGTPEKKLNAVQNALAKNEDKTPVIVAARRNGDEYLIKSNRFAVDPREKLLLRLKELLGNSAVYLQPFV